MTLHKSNQIIHCTQLGLSFSLKEREKENVFRAWLTTYYLSAASFNKIWVIFRWERKPAPRIKDVVLVSWEGEGEWVRFWDLINLLVLPSPHILKKITKRILFNKKGVLFDGFKSNYPLKVFTNVQSSIELACIM